MLRRCLMIGCCILAATFGLAGCAPFLFLQHSTGASIPTPSDERDYIVDTVAGATASVEGRSLPVPPGLYIIATIVHTNEKCSAFFDMLEKFKQDSELIGKVLTAGAAAGSPLVALVGATGSEVARFTSALSFGNQLNQYTADIYAFSTYKDSLKKHVFEGMAGYQKAKGIDLFFQTRVGVTKVERLTGTSAAGPFSVIDIASDLGGTKGEAVLLLPVGPDPSDKTRTIFSRITVNKADLWKFAAGSDKLAYPGDILIARSVGSEYASLCSLATMRQIIADALARSETTVRPSPNGSPPTTDTGPRSPKA